MQELDDKALLREYIERNSENAFAALVTRHVNKVYSIALRHTRNPHQAEEITQAVFVILAKKSRNLSKSVVISGWLCRTARLTAVTLMRGEIRRARREQEACMQTLLNEKEPDVWPQIAPLLDAAMAGLNETDYHAIVLRFFDGKSMGEIGEALGASEDAAKKRVSRALEKLRLFFAKRGVAVSAAVLTTAISANSVEAAPTLLAKTATTVALAKGATASTSTLTLIKGALKLMAWTKLKTAVVTGVILLLVGGSATLVVVKGRSGLNQRTSLEAQTRNIKEAVFPGILKYASAHGDSIPGSINDLKPYLQDNLGDFDDAHWQISASGNLKPLLTRGDVVLLQQKNVPTGQRKIIVFTDGHVEWK